MYFKYFLSLIHVFEIVTLNTLKILFVKMNEPILMFVFEIIYVFNWTLTEYLFISNNFCIFKYKIYFNTI